VSSVLGITIFIGNDEIILVTKKEQQGHLRKCKGAIGEED
jgi:hypothetical protein